eukprot:16451910-Heterocapsa_arctica.AAC.1
MAAGLCAVGSAKVSSMTGGLVFGPQRGWADSEHPRAGSSQLDAGPWSARPEADVGFWTSGRSRGIGAADS